MPTVVRRSEFTSEIFGSVRILTDGRTDGRIVSSCRSFFQPMKFAVQLSDRNKQRRLLCAQKGFFNLNGPR